MAQGLEEFGRSFQRFMESMAAAEPAGEPPFLAMLREQFGCDPNELVIVGESFGAEHHANVQLAMERITDGAAARLVGIEGSDHEWSLSASALLKRGGGIHSRVLCVGPVQYVTRDRDRGVPLSCVQLGLYLVASPTPFAALVKGPSDMGFARRVTIEILAREQAKAEEVIRELRYGVRELNVYRGKVISLDADRRDNIAVTFRELPSIAREAIVLPDGLLERIERDTVRFSELGERLRAAGRHLKRGLLLHGPPGTGKTLTAMYLAARMQGRTVIIITGRGAGLIEHACELARYLEPAMVILEDADLIAEERSREHACGALLFELLNQMDGISEDVDILFVLTTNRPDVLEPALAARPGRIDQAVEIPLPDDSGRRRLIDLYARGITMQVEDLGPLVRRTAGTSGAFIRELLRKATLLAADEDPDGIVVTEKHLDEAFREIVIVGGELTQALLGAGRAGAGEKIT